MSQASMDYEYFIRRAHQTERFKHGGNSDYFQALEQANELLQQERERLNVNPNAYRKQFEKTEKEYKKKSHEIRNFLNKAIVKALSKFGKKITDEGKNELLDCKNLLANDDLATINEVVRHADKVLLDIGLYPSQQKAIKFRKVP